MQGHPGPPTEKTLRNIRQARAHSFWLGRYHVEWKAFTGACLFAPRTYSESEEFWNEGPVKWYRFYWLTFGVSVYWLLPERRMVVDPKWSDLFNRRGKHGNKQTD